MPEVNFKLSVVEMAFSANLLVAPFVDLFSTHEKWSVKRSSIQFNLFFISGFHKQLHNVSEWRYAFKTRMVNLFNFVEETIGEMIMSYGW